tara:strand:+ start:2538 stop:3896 length:1359 start_codon:yes stop_codon:yes gene_type:complete
MAGRYKAYPGYKESGVEWLGRIPTGWAIAPIKRISGIYNGATPKSAISAYWDGDIPWITPADMGKAKTPYIGHGARSISQLGYDSCGTTLVPSDSVILSARAPIGTLGIALNQLCTNQGCKSLVTERSYDSVFLYYILASSTEQLNLLGRGTTFLELSADKLGAYKISVPPLPEQKQIAHFLDHETAKIDLLIAKQQALIALLKEKRQAVISHAVTKGLNPNAKMKDSGVEWLGDVPEHWSRKSLNYLIAHTVDNRGRTPPVTDSGIPMCEVSQVAGDGFYTSKSYSKFITQGSYEQFVRSDVKENDVLFVTVGATFGKTCLVPPEPDFFIAQNVVGFRCQLDVDPKFFMFLLSSEVFKEAISATNKSSTIDNVKVSDLVKTKLVVPPHEEQRQIVDHIFTIVDHFLLLISKAESAIELMQERRTALISAAVTGKIDVRDWAPAPEGSEVVA